MREQEAAEHQALEAAVREASIDPDDEADDDGHKKKKKKKHKGRKERDD